MTTATETYAVTVPDSDLVSFGDDVLERAGKIVVDALRRRRNALLCERDGHDWSPMSFESNPDFKLCGRCMFYEGELPKA